LLLVLCLSGDMICNTDPVFAHTLLQALLHYNVAAQLNRDDTAIQYELGRLLLSLVHSRVLISHCVLN